VNFVGLDFGGFLFKNVIFYQKGVNQLEDPREQWRKMQESMIHHYLQSAKGSIQVKHIFSILFL